MEELRTDTATEREVASAAAGSGHVMVLKLEQRQATFCLIILVLCACRLLRLQRDGVLSCSCLKMFPFACQETSKRKEQLGASSTILILSP